MSYLTHVCMWQDKGWKRVSAEEAARLHPGGTVSARSGLFMCELCGQYVVFTDGDIRIRHFRHSSNEKSKDCPERVQGIGAALGYNPLEHDLPIKIVDITSSGFSLEMGFIQLPDAMYETDMRVIINSPILNSNKEYNSERLNKEGITYLRLGKTPASKYTINIVNGHKDIHKYWPKTVSGIDSSGTLFSKDTGKKLPNDADVVINKPYYLLSRYSISIPLSAHIKTSVICNDTSTHWILYEIVASEYCEGAARFFLDHHCRLTDEQAKLIPVWPVHIKTPYIVKHNSNDLVFVLKGNAELRSYPIAGIGTYQLMNARLLTAKCSSIQQMIAVGRKNSLNYSYYWRCDLDEVRELPKPMVTDLNGKQICNERACVPYKGTIFINLPYDGKIIRKTDGLVVDILNIKANESIDINGIDSNQEISIYIGLDEVWKSVFSRERSSGDSRDSELLNKLIQYHGCEIDAPRELIRLLESIKTDSDLTKWITTCIKKNRIDKRAYKILKSYIINCK